MKKFLTSQCTRRFAKTRSALVTGTFGMDKNEWIRVYLVKANGMGN